MAATSFNPFAGSGFPPRQSVDLNPNPNLLEFNLQRHIAEEQALSPGGARPGDYFSPASILPQSTSSAVTHQYGQTVSDVDAGFTYALDVAFPNSSPHQTNGGGNGSNEGTVPANPHPSPTFPQAKGHSFRNFGRQPASFLHQQQQPLPDYSTAQLTATIQTPRLSPPPVSPLAPSPQTHRRRRAAPKPRAPREDDVIGLVLLNKKKFKCANRDCEELTFGRLADLRRHHDQQHAKVRHQYFCSFVGCSRSNAVTGGRGRSFGTRKDKRDEHERNVHKKQTQDDRELSFSSESGDF